MKISFTLATIAALCLSASLGAADVVPSRDQVKSAVETASGQSFDSRAGKYRGARGGTR